jgi:hypothetical protein
VITARGEGKKVFFLLPMSKLSLRWKFLLVQKENDPSWTEPLLLQLNSDVVFIFYEFFFLKDPIYLQSVTIHSANGGKGEGWHVEKYSVALLC